MISNIEVMRVMNYKKENQQENESSEDDVYRYRRNLCLQCGINPVSQDIVGGRLSFMKIKLTMICVSLLLALPFAAAENLSTDAPVIFMVGDSTMSDKPLFPAQPERGWGQLLSMYFKDDVRVRNLARNGRSSKSFRSEGRWDTVMKELQPGDFVIIQFGHNDQKSHDPSRYTEAFGSFKENLARYVREARSIGGKPILATPVVRRKFADEKELNDTHGDYSVAVRQVAKELQAPLLDIEKQSAVLVKKLGPQLSKKLYMWIEPIEYDAVKNGRQDDTHLNAFGASRICDMAVRDIRSAVPELGRWLR
jgi:lysophospholipase L1-like esterase